MRRTPLHRKTPLRQTDKPLRRKKALGRSNGRLKIRRAEDLEAAARATWKAKRYGNCAVCGRYGRLIRHHVLLEQMVRVAGGNPYDLRNAMDLGASCSCHVGHHGGGDGRISFPLVPKAAVDFTRETIGEGPMEAYFTRRYRDAPYNQSNREGGFALWR